MTKITIFLLASLTFFLTKSLHAQINADFENEEAFKSYLLDNIIQLDPIEGIWSVTYSYTRDVFDLNGNELYSVPIKTSTRLIVYKKNGLYKSYVSYGLYIADDSNLGYLSYNFEKTAKNGTYLYSVRDDGYHEGYVDISNNSFSILRKSTEKYKDVLIEKNEVKLEGIKLSPNTDDVNEALAKAKKAEEPEKISGTAFALGNSGFLVTAYHVVDSMNSIEIKDMRANGLKSYQCNVIEKDRGNDLAILKIIDDRFNGFQNIPYAFRNSKLQVGEDVFTLGYPLKSTMGEEIKLTNGIVSASSGYEGDTTLLQISVPVQPGNSGGPLFDKNGNLCGIVVAKYTNAENATYAVKTNELMKLLKKIPVSTLPAASLISSKDLPNKVSVLKDYVFIVEANKK